MAMPEANYQPSGRGGTVRQLYSNPSGPARSSTMVTGGSGGGGMTVDMKDYVDARTDAVRSDVSADLSRFEAKLDAFPARMVWTVGGGVLATVGLFLALVAYGGDRFESGIGLGSSNAVAVHENQSAIEELRGDIKLILEALTDEPVEAPDEQE